ncbi:hypothetical protein H9P43_003924 [Blastocladiella emersonii ATCC 22665]|nr:hypothetical protein H9P43_003918 [Blastocladiella emersonii ATCC 22665]KAI9183008.1 hypothetical protein H9P43_003924 [Blastocladiella emersonii ATCC 22665]
MNVREFDLRDPWDPLDWDHSMPFRELNIFLLIQAIGVVILNAMIIIASYRCRHKILVNASNQLSVNLSIGYLCYGLCTVGIRLALVADFAWSEGLCRFAEMSHVNFIALTIFAITNMAVERYMSIIRFKALTRKQATRMSMGAQFLALVDMLVHTLGHRPVISRSGITCYPSSMGLALGTVDMILLSSQSITIAIVYLLILRTLRKASRKIDKSAPGQSVGNQSTTTQTQATSASDPTASTKQMLSPTTPVTPGLGNNKGTAAAERMETQMSGLLRAASATADSASAGGLLRAASGTADNPNMSGSLLPAASSTVAETSGNGRTKITSSHAASKAARNAEIEKRILLRGIASLVASLFTSVPTTALVGQLVATGERTTGLYDACTCKFITEIADPVILLTMDVRFRSAVRETFFWWLPQPAKPIDPANRSGTAL